MDNYKDDYDSSMREVWRLRGVAREFESFYTKIKEATDKQDWELVKKALEESE